MIKTILFGTALSIFLILMTPNISAIEFNQSAEMQKSLFNQSTIKSTYVTKYIQFRTFKSLFNNLFLKLRLVQKNNWFFDDPGNGTDGKGPDDITDIWYMIKFLITLLIFGPFVIADIVIYALIWIFIIGFLWILIFMPAFLERLVEILLPNSDSIFAIIFMPVFFIFEVFDYADMDLDGR